MVECLRCGKCCTLPGKEQKKCKFLITFPSGLTGCRIYRSRLGVVIGKYRGKRVICVKREDSKQNYDGCPYNNKVK